MNSPAWYSGTRDEFLGASNIDIADKLAGRAAAESLEIEAYQNEEWLKSIELLQQSLSQRIPILRAALQSDAGELVRHVVLEFDFRRRGLRMDCLLFGDGVLFVIEFKRSKIESADRDQVMTYAINLLEFHELTRKLSDLGKGLIVVPVITLTEGRTKKAATWPGLGGHSWPAAATRPIECDPTSLCTALELGFAARITDIPISATCWLASPFSPSSSILDAALSLYGNHDVSAIREHAAPRAEIESSVSEIRTVIECALSQAEYHVVFLSGAPGAGKTLVGLELVMRGNRAGETVFVTGNAPLVDVLNAALGKSYRAQGRNSSNWAPTGYLRTDAHLLATAADYKIVKAHRFLGRRSQAHGQRDGRVLVFDEAQRTYKAGKTVLGEKLPDHEADLILDVQTRDYPKGGSVVVALVGHNQAIGPSELGILAWLEAIDRKKWTFSIADETLQLAEIKDPERWARHPMRRQLANGHLRQSMRFYRNSRVEQWAASVLEGDAEEASRIAGDLDANDNTIFMTRNLACARTWAKSHTIGSLRSGIIASGQARRLAAVGLFVDYKPDIATWMLAPSTDVRSSNALETVQNQYQIQGLELDYCIVCWDADLRRESDRWMAYKLNGSKWKRDSRLEVALNGYRVLLTRARKGMVVFVPMGDVTGEDETRPPEFYDSVWNWLLECGARELPAT